MILVKLCSLQIIKLAVKLGEVYKEIMTPQGLVHGSYTSWTRSVMSSCLFVLLIPRTSLA